MTIPENAILPETETTEFTPASDFTVHALDDVPEAAFLRIDLVPANAQFTPKEGAPAEAKFFPNARIIVTDGYAYVFSEGGPDPIRNFQGTLTGFTGSNKEGYTAHFPDGTLYFRRSESCACGSRLRGIRPFPYVQQAPLSIF
jgi:hypothetical protein